MKSVMKKVLCAFSVFSFAVLLSLCGSINAEAKETTTYPTAYCIKAPRSGHLMRIGEDRKYIVDIKSSNEKVIIVSNPKQQKSGTNFQAIGTGTSTITYTMKKNGKKYKATQKYVVMDIKPFKSFKLNGKDITKKVNTRESNVQIKSKTKKYTIKWQIASGLKVCKPDKTQDGSYSLPKTQITKKSGTMKFSGDNFHGVYLQDSKGHYLGEFYFHIENN